MKSGDLVRYFCKNTESVKYGMFLCFGEKHKDVNDYRKSGVLIASDGKLIKSFNFLKVNYDI
jgi:hypothetical protein